MKFYAVQHGDNFDWDNGSENYDEAVTMANAMANDKMYDDQEIRITTINDDCCEDEEIVRAGYRVCPIYTVTYQGGQSRYSDKAVDYMMADVDGVELYAEAEPVESDETGTFGGLKAEILRQAEENGINPDELIF